MTSALSPTTASTAPRVMKFIVLGESAVGKTSLLGRFCHGRFVPFSPTVGVEFKWYDLNLDGVFVRLHLWDTAGQEAYRSIAKPYYRQADGVLLVYDCTNAQRTLEGLRSLIRDARDCCPPGVVMALLANKCDVDPRLSSEAVELGEVFAREYNLPIFYLTSAKEGTHVHDSFVSLARHVVLVKKVHSIGAPKLCGICKEATASSHCDQCSHDFCEGCYISAHELGSPKYHNRIPIVVDPSSGGSKNSMGDMTTGGSSSNTANLRTSDGKGRKMKKKCC